jgi:redox-sensing transcriptional repressor
MKRENAVEVKPLAWPTVQRLSEYLLVLEQFMKQDRAVVSSHDLAELYGNNASQVRQDLFRLPNTGRVGHGYRTALLAAAIRAALGLEQITRVAIVGCGKLGAALAEHVDFSAYGMVLEGLFDQDPAVIGTNLGGVLVEDAAGLTVTIRKRTITVAALCVPPDAAQAVTDDLVGAGIHGILNYTRQRLRVPASVHVQDRQVICSFLQLAYMSNRIPMGTADD